MTMQLDHDQLHRLLAALADSDIQEFRLEGDDFRLEIRRNLPNSQVNIPAVQSVVHEVVTSQTPELRTETAAPSPTTPPPAMMASRADLVDVAAPMVGTFYRSPGPDEDPFVEVGARISLGQTVCILEAMKLMNGIPSDKAGIIREVLVENGQPVEYGQILFRIG